MRINLQQEQRGRAAAAEHLELRGRVGSARGHSRANGCARCAGPPGPGPWPPLLEPEPPPMPGPPPPAGPAQMEEEEGMMEGDAGLMEDDARKEQLQTRNLKCRIPRVPPFPETSSTA